MENTKEERPALVAAKTKSETKKEPVAVSIHSYIAGRKHTEIFKYVNGELADYELKGPLLVCK